MTETFLLAVDASPASERAVDYFARVVGSLEGAEVHLAHVVPAADLARQAVGGKESAIEIAARALLESMRDRLASQGLPAERVDLGLLSHNPETSLVDDLLELARARECGTIVMGRNSLPWYREKLHHHPADELVRKAGGGSVWVIE